MTHTLTVAQTARLLTCHRQNVHNLIRRGKLRVAGTVPGRGPTGVNLLVDAAAVRRLMAHGHGLDVPGRRGRKPGTKVKAGRAS
jgi:hypothetical protein